MVEKFDVSGTECQEQYSEHEKLEGTEKPEKENLEDDDIADEDMNRLLKEVEDDCPEDEKEIKFVPVNDGKWEGKKGDSLWIPDDDKVPEKMNADAKKWSEIKEKYGIEGIEFHDGEPDFSEIARGEAKIDGFSADRNKNFTKADECEAERRGCKPEDVRQWRQDNKYTWHERSDQMTMDKVPSEVHSNIYHKGGVSEAKKEESDQTDAENKRRSMEDWEG